MDFVGIKIVSAPRLSLLNTTDIEEREYSVLTIQPVECKEGCRVNWGPHRNVI